MQEKNLDRRARRQRMRRVHRCRRYLRRIRWLRGSTWAKMANFGIALFGLSSDRIKYDRQDGEFIITGETEHRLAHKERFRFFVEGLSERGTAIGRSYLLHRISFEHGDTVVDCGANVGDLGLYFLSIKTKINMICFEPSPIEYSALRKNLRQNSYVEALDVQNIALFDDNKEKIDFFIKSKSADSSVFPIADFEERISVPCMRLDAILPPGRHKLLKVEAEGAEPEILRGSIGVLSCFDYVTVDAGFERGLAQETTAPEVLRFMLSNGFELVDVNTKRVAFLFRRIGVDEWNPQ